MDKVKQKVRAGVSVPAAIKDTLAQSGFKTIEAFAAKHGLIRSAVSNHINGNVRPTDETIAALIEELAGTPDEWRELLWMAAKPVSVAPSPEPTKPKSVKRAASPGFVPPPPPRSRTERSTCAKQEW